MLQAQVKSHPEAQKTTSKSNLTSSSDRTTAAYNLNSQSA